MPQTKLTGTNPSYTYSLKKYTVDVQRHVTRLRQPSLTTASIRILKQFFLKLFTQPLCGRHKCIPSFIGQWCLSIGGKFLKFHWKTFRTNYSRMDQVKFSVFPSLNKKKCLILLTTNVRKTSMSPRMNYSNFIT